MYNNQTQKFNILKCEIKNKVLSSAEHDEDISEEKAYELIDRYIEEHEKTDPLLLRDKIKLRTSVYNSLKKYDILTELLEDKNVNEIMINSFEEIFIDKKGKIERWDKSFENNDELYNIIQQIVSKINRTVNVQNPIVDARLEDGSRVHVVLPPIALKGATVTIRKFPERFSMKKLIENKTIDEETANFLKLLVVNGYNIFISGGTGSGKTTFLNALSEYIPEDERVITIEDSAELNISHVKNLVSLETRNKNLEGNGEIDMAMLIKASLRMNPDRIVVGEVRGKEALDMLQSMNTGHEGSMSTGHANSSIDMLSRLETMIMMAENLPLKAIRQQIASSIDIIIHLDKNRDKKRVVREIVELGALDGDKYTTNRLYEYEKDHLVKLAELSNTRKIDKRL